VSPEDARALRGPLSAVAAEALSAESTAAMATPGDYAQLAEALENDPLRIYQYVRNHFEYVPYFGALKGPYLTLHERAGNDFDQAALLVELLRAAGFTANFRYGTASVDTTAPLQLQTLADWLGTDADAQIIAGTFSNGGVPVEQVGTNLEFDRVWVEVDIGGSTVSLDPAFKLLSKGGGIDLDAATGFTTSALLAAAGGTLGTDSIEGLSESGVDAHLTSLTAQLLGFLDENHPNATVEEILGGYTIIPDHGDSLPTALPLPVTPTDPPWATMPASVLHTVQLVHGGIDITFETREVAGRKLSLSYAGEDITIPPPPAGAQDFGSVAQGEAGPTLTLDPSNPNSVTIQVTSTLSGSGAGAYEFTTGGGTQNIPPGGSVEVGVRLTGVGQSAGRKNATLTLEFTASGSPIGTQTVDLTGVVEPDRIAEIYLDDALQAGETTPSGNLTELLVTVDHPYAANGGTLFDQTEPFNVKRTGSYVLASGFGGDRNSTLLTERQRLLGRMDLQGLAPDAREVVSETLNVIGQTWMLQTQLNADVLTAISGTRQIRHHRFGIAGQEEGYFVDVRAQVVSTPARTSAALEGAFQAGGFVASAMEHSVLEQLQGADNPGISTIKIFALNNQQGGKLFLADQANFASIEPQLTNYSASDLSQFQALVNAGSTLVLPEDGGVTLNQWSGKGYVDYRVDGTSRSLGMIIGGGLNGGFASQPQFVDPAPTRTQGILQATPPAEVETQTALDPVDLGSGAYVNEMTDLAVAGEGPRGIAFTRTYNSQQNGEDRAGLGRGWNHSYKITIDENSQVSLALGGRTPADAAPRIAAVHAMRSLLEDTQPALEDWAVSALVADWVTDRILNQTVTARIGDRALSYQRMPDGSFVAPPGVTAELVDVGGGAYEIRERFGTVLAFDSNGRITALTDVDGNALTFTYAGDKLTEVEDSVNRALTFGYTGDALTSVTGPTGRSVDYTFTGGNLTGVTGLEGATWAYAYDGLERLLTVTDPEGVTIVDNTYDAFDRVVEQRAPRKTGAEVYRLHYGGLFAAEEDPLGNRGTYHYDFDGRTVVFENANGEIARTAYDSQG